LERRMTTLDPQFVVNPNDPQYIADPYPTYRTLRENAPVYQWPMLHAIVFSRYHDVKALLSDRRLTSDPKYWEFVQPDRIGPEHAEFRELRARDLVHLSNRDHDRVRKLATSALTRRSVEKMRDDIQRIVDTTLQSTVQNGTVDVRDFAEIIPLQVIGGFFNIPPGELQQEFKAFATALLETLDPMTPPEAIAEPLSHMPRWIGMFRDLIADRRKNPIADDFLSQLISARDEGDKLSEQEMLSLLYILIVGGTETTVHAICFAIRALLKHPGELALLQNDPSLLRNAVEESLRFDFLLKIGVPKFAPENMEIRGVSIAKGQMLIPLMGSAMHDPEVFPDPERFDIRRDVSQTLPFSIGPHFCLGAALARLTLDTTVHTVVQRFPGMKLLSEPVFEPHYVARPMKGLRVQLA
jgi:cytochrome P450